MGLLSTLANVGLTIGKVAMSIFGGKAIALANGEQYTVAYCKAGDIAFVSKTKQGRSDIYMCNTSPLRKYVASLPPDSDDETKEGEVVYMGPIEEYPVTDWFADDKSPRQQIYVSPCNDPEADSAGASPSSALNLSFNKLQLNGKPVKLGGFTISAMERSGAKGINIACQYPQGLSKLSTCRLTNDKGVSMFLSEPIAPSSKGVAAGEERFYPLDYTAEGFKDGDYVSGVVNIEVKDTNVLTANCAHSRKILPEELIRCIR